MFSTGRGSSVARAHIGLLRADRVFGDVNPWDAV